MTPAVLEADHRRPDSANDQLAGNAERALWAAHVQAAQLLDDEPGPVSRDILNTVDQRWQRAFLEMDQ